MGGVGSGNWRGIDKKTTVEDCLSLAVWDLPDQMFPGLTGTVFWIGCGANKPTIEYDVTRDDDLVITLRYQRYQEDMEVPIGLQTTRPHFGGSRRWFTCPFCQRRCGKLYLPPASRYFEC